MKVKLDENLPLQIAVELRARLHDVQTVWEEGLSGHADLDIWEGAQREGRVLITQDLDFSDARKFVPGTHHGIVLIRLRSPSRTSLERRTSSLECIGSDPPRLRLDPTVVRKPAPADPASRRLEVSIMRHDVES
jgi:predicted nuclease of predicted toxin-antitoxin system